MKKGKNINKSKIWTILEYAILLIPYTLYLLISACDLPTDPGPMPTDIIDTDFKPGLNILGVLRLDGITGTSFIRVERAYHIEETDTMEWDAYFSPVVSNAEVIVQGATNKISYIFSFVDDSIRGDIYTNDNFSPLEGEQYSLTINSPELPELTATTSIPVKPSIDSTTLVVSDHSVSFDLLSTTDTDIYDVFLVFPNDTLHQRIVNNNDERISTHFSFSSVLGQAMWVEIYGFDANLAEYLTFTITIKPQIYQETVTTVTGGYGCFGAVSKTTIHL